MKKQKNKQAINLCFICDENYALPTCVTIESLKINKSKHSEYNIYILAQNLSQNSITKLKNLQSVDMLINIIDDYSIQIDMEKINIERHVSIAALTKFFIPNILKSINKVIYLDSDILIQNDLYELYNTKIEDYYAGVVMDTMTICGKNGHLKKMNFPWKAYFNSGVLLLNLKKLREDNITDKLMYYRLNGYNHFMDQDALNVVLGGKVKYLSIRYNLLNVYFDSLSISELEKLYKEKFYSTRVENYENATILHLGGKEKPWNKFIEYLTPLYKKYAEKTNWRIDYFPKVSILVPIYNVEKYLRECLDSIKNQTLKDIEVLLLDDGSTDSCPQICDEYCKNDSRFKVIHKPNSGYGATMNIGLDNATGEYIGIVESDDFIDSEMFEFLYTKINEKQCDFVKENYNQYKTTENSNKLIEAFNKKDIYGKVIEPITVKKTFNGAPSIWSAIYKRDFLKNNNIRFNETPGASFQDTSFWIKVLLKAKRAMFVKEAHLHYRSDNLASSVKDCKKIFCVCDEFTELNKFCQGNTSELKIVEALKIDKYLWNIKRLTEEAKKEFLLKTSEDIVNIINQNKYDSEVLNMNIIDKELHILGIKTRPFVSLIIPVYNAEKYLKECLDSAINQTLKNIEIICINDGSTDNSLQILNEYAQKDTRIKVLTQKNQKQGAARNKGLKIAQGEYIQFLDSDDYLINSACELLYNQMKKNNLDMLMFGGDNFSDKTKTTNIYQQYHFQYFPKEWNKEIFNYKDCLPFINRLPVAACLTMYKRDFIEIYKIEFPEKLFFEDNVFFVKSILNAQRVGLLKNIIYYRRVYDNSTTKRLNILFDDYLKIVELVLSYVKKQNDYIYQIYKKWYIKEVMHHFNNFSVEEQKKYKKQIVKLTSKYTDHKLSTYLLLPYYLPRLFYLRKKYFKTIVYNLYKKLITIRIDIKNFGTENNTVDVITTAKVNKPSWFANAQGQGAVVEANQNILKLTIKAIQNGKLRLEFKGMDKRANGVRFPLWVDYKSIKINGKEILSSPITTWHDKPFRYEMPVKDGQIVTVEVIQKYHQYSKTELKEVILKLNPASDYIKSHIKKVTKKIYRKITNKSGFVNKIKRLKNKFSFAHKTSPVLDLIRQNQATLQQLQTQNNELKKEIEVLKKLIQSK
ncbi:MAG: glycosyltransferase [Alphaproteobacteria bacterium]|nr:glycosyltransferase [Alphaproteobacteria bacterium]